MSVISVWAKAIELARQAANVTLPGLIDQLADRFGDREALIGTKEVLTYRQLADRINGYARWAAVAGVAGRTIALLMPNSPDYVATWLGLTKAGCTVALLNTALNGAALQHCFSIAKADLLICDELIDDVECDQLCWPPRDVGPQVLPPSPKPNDIGLLIYTSGTTGLPKAAKLTHRRITEWSYWFAGMTSATADDRLYDCLPMYHSVGGVVAVGSMLVSGAAVVIRKQFSASRFWRDIVQERCTIFQYIGELCRFLTLTPPSVGENQHSLRLAVGNGLHIDVWQVFQTRFAIPQILEYYAATEGVVSLYNVEGKPGSIGRIPPALRGHFGVRLIKVDDEGEPLRGENGLCVACHADEPGEAIGRLSTSRPFDGYDDAMASSRKVLTNVFESGDRWFRTGDLMRHDKAGYFYFVDRLGDTFRWRGENVSTTEVESVLRSCSGVADAIVFGVRVPGNEGRAGMAAITTTSSFEWEVLAACIRQHLPDYARPLFVRLCASLDVTGTFKLSKKRFADEGFVAASEPVWTYKEGIFMPHKS